MASHDGAGENGRRLVLVHKLATVHDCHSAALGRTLYIAIHPCVSSAPTHEFHDVLSKLSCIIDVSRDGPQMSMPTWVFDVRRVVHVNTLTIAGVAMSLAPATRSAIYACMSQIVVVTRCTAHSDTIAAVIGPIFHKPFRAVTGATPAALAYLPETVDGVAVAV